MIVSTVSMMSSFGPVAALSGLAGNLTHTLAAGERVLGILDENPVVEENIDGKTVAFDGIENENVGFAYGDEKILDGFNMTVEPDKIISITGPSGSGKSTALKLMMRFWDVQQGSIKMSGEDIRDKDLVPQKQPEPCQSGDAAFQRFDRVQYKNSRLQRHA